MENRLYTNYLKLSSILKFSSLNYFQSFLSFSASIFLARNIGKELYGEYALGLIFFNILSTIIQFGSEKTLIRDLVQKKEPKSVLKAATFINIFISLTALISIFIWLYFQSISISGVAIITLFSFAGICLGLSPAAWFDYKGEIHFQALLLLVEKLFFLVSIFVILFFSKNSSLTAFYAALAFLVCRLACALKEWHFVFSDFEGESTKTLFYLKQILSNNVWIWIAVLGNMLMSQGNQLILKSDTSSSELASYAIAFQLIMMIRLFQRQIVRLMSPAIAELTKLGSNNMKFIRRRMHKYYFLSLISSLVLVIPLFIISPVLIKVVVGPQYLDAVPIFRILLIWISLFGLALVNNQFLISFNLNRTFLLITTFFGIISLFLSYSMIPIYQGRGAAISLLVSHYGSIFTQVFAVEIFIRKAIKAGMPLSN